MDWVSGVLDGVIKRSGILSMDLRKYRNLWELLVVCFALFPFSLIWPLVATSVISQLSKILHARKQPSKNYSNGHFGRRPRSK
jgi:hypothetical protein